MNNSIDRKKIESLLPHRDPMLLIDKLINIVHLKSATAIMYVKKTDFFVRVSNFFFLGGPRRDPRRFLNAILLAEKKSACGSTGGSTKTWIFKKLVFW